MVLWVQIPVGGHGVYHTVESWVLPGLDPVWQFCSRHNTIGDRRIEVLLRQEFAGSNPVGGYFHRKQPEQREVIFLSTPGPASVVSRSRTHPEGRQAVACV